MSAGAGRTWFALVLTFAVSTATAVGASEAAPCADRLLADPRLNWLPGWPELRRKPPDVFESKMLALQAPHLVALPGGLTPAEHAFYGGVFALLRDHRRTFTLLRELIEEMRTAPGETDRDRLAAVLTAYENHHGLRVREITGAQPAATWLGLIADGYTFIDHAAADVALSLHAPALDRTFYARPGRWRHGAHSHRLQLHLVLRDLKRNSAAYGAAGSDSASVSDSVSVLALYRRLGDRAWSRGLDWSQTGLFDETGRAFGPRGLFFHLFDSAENNPSSPGYFDEYREYWPEIPEGTRLLSVVHCGAE